MKCPRCNVELVLCWKVHNKVSARDYWKHPPLTCDDCLRLPDPEHFRGEYAVCSDPEADNIAREKWRARVKELLEGEPPFVKIIGGYNGFNHSEKITYSYKTATAEIFGETITDWKIT